MGSAALQSWRDKRASRRRVTARRIASPFQHGSAPYETGAVALGGWNIDLLRCVAVAGTIVAVALITILNLASADPVAKNVRDLHDRCVEKAIADDPSLPFTETRGPGFEAWAKLTREQIKANVDIGGVGRVAKCLYDAGQYAAGLATVQPVIRTLRSRTYSGLVTDPDRTWHTYALLLDATGDRVGAQHAISIAMNLARDADRPSEVQADYKRLGQADTAKGPPAAKTRSLKERAAAQALERVK
jgi:hypothetical protein